MSKKNQPSKPCKHDWVAGLNWGKQLGDGMHCQKCQLERPFTQIENDSFKAGLWRGRKIAWITIRDRFATIMRVELEARP